jgi:formate C-acetyltransferase
MLSERLQNMQIRVRDRECKRYRKTKVPDLLSEFAQSEISWMQRSELLTRRMCEAEEAAIEPDENIVFTRTIPDVPAIWDHDEYTEIIKDNTLHELGPINNICANWGMVLDQGLLKRRDVATETKIHMAENPEAVEFLQSAINTIDSVLQLAKKYEHKAREMGKDKIADSLKHVPAHQPKTFHQALQFLRIVHAVLWMSGHYHVGLGRFDQYMWPYLKADLDFGRIDVEGAEELLAEFFISLNKDSDLYVGIQQGDNGQSLMLGGVKRDGQSAVNDLTSMVLRVSRDVSMIDPKINLRINKDTDLELLSLATELTRQGLGFPQYANDDVIIPALVNHGYTLEDARDYVVAACWEFILPGKGMEVVNIGAVSFPAAVDKALKNGLSAGDKFDKILERVAQNIDIQVNKIVNVYHNLWLPPAPYYSVLMDDCLENGRDLSLGAIYNNFGIHGAASSNAADALAAVKRFVFEENKLTPTDLIHATETNYKNNEDLRLMLHENGPKVGNNDDHADEMLVTLFNYFADSCENITDNGRGGIVRPGTGSAMYYVWLARGHDGMREPVVGATADGRKEGEFFSSSLAPSPGVKIRGPISVLQSYSKLNYNRICNGGPVTMELSDMVFRDPESIRKVAMMIRTFAQIGCQQLQLNTVNIEILKDAKIHPERHKNLIVRVWGWSGYFCELAPEYQDHIILRNMYSM